MAKKQDPLTSFRPSDYSGFTQSTLAMERAKAIAQDQAQSQSQTQTQAQAGTKAQAELSWS